MAMVIWQASCACGSPALCEYSGACVCVLVDVRVCEWVFQWLCVCVRVGFGVYMCVCACCVFLGTEALLAHDSRSSSRVVRVSVCMLVCVGARGFVCACVRVCCVRVTLCCVADKLPLA